MIWVGNGDSARGCITRSYNFNDDVIPVRHVLLGETRGNRDGGEIKALRELSRGVSTDSILQSYCAAMLLRRIHALFGMRDRRVCHRRLGDSF